MYEKPLLILMSEVALHLITALIFICLVQYFNRKQDFTILLLIGLKVHYMMIYYVSKGVVLWIKFKLESSS